MCPMCLTTIGLYVAGAASAGGFTAYLGSKLLRTEHAMEGEEHDDDAQDRNA